MRLPLDLAKDHTKMQRTEMGEYRRIIDLGEFISALGSALTLDPNGGRGVFIYVLVVFRRSQLPGRHSKAIDAYTLEKTGSKDHTQKGK